MNKKAILSIIAVVAIIVSATFSFMSSDNTKHQIYVFLPSADNPFWIEVRNGVEDEAEKYNDKFDVSILTTNSTEASNQADQLQNILKRRAVDGVVIGLANNRAPAPIIALYNQKNIPVVMIDTDLDPNAAKAAGAQWDVFIGSDNRFGGKIAAEAMIKAIANNSDNKNVLLLKGSYIHQSAIDRAEGFIAGAGDNFQIIERDGEWNRQRATEITESVMARKPVAGIFASNDDMALGVVAGLENLNIKKSERPVIIGFDATFAGMEAIKRGDLYASIKQQAAIMGSSGLANVISLVRGEKVTPKKTLIPVKVVFGDPKTK